MCDLLPCHRGPQVATPGIPVVVVTFQQVTSLLNIYMQVKHNAF